MQNYPVIQLTKRHTVISVLIQVCCVSRHFSVDDVQTRVFFPAPLNLALSRSQVVETGVHPGGGGAEVGLGASYLHKGQNSNAILSCYPAHKAAHCYICAYTSLMRH